MAAGGGGGGSARVLPKDVQDRMLFDAQAATFFNYLIEKAGIDKAKEVIRQDIQGKEPLEMVKGFLGEDFEKVERDWVGMAQDPEIRESQGNNNRNLA